MSRDSSRSLWILSASLGAVILIGAVAAILIFSRPRPGLNTDHPPVIETDPRRLYSGPYQNIHPDSAYSGDEACAGCHADKEDSYRNHPMGRSLATVAAAAWPPLDPAHRNPFDALGSQFRIRRQGEIAHQIERRQDDSGRVLFEQAHPIQFVVGSGNHGHSYLQVRDGFVFQAPLSWYSGKQIWDLAPGWVSTHALRPVVPECLFCHTNRVEHVHATLNRYSEPLFQGHAIGCERCHGPGEKHVAAWSGVNSPPKPDWTIVNPARLSPRLRDAVCEQCHLEGETRMIRRGRGLFDFRPGLPLEEFWAVFTHTQGENFNAVNHVEQMHQSRCFTRSAGEHQLGCITCHDPHVRVAPADRVAHYRQACMKCHADRGCLISPEVRQRTTVADSCIDCHMTRFPAADIAHTAATDHRILRKAAPVMPRIESPPALEGSLPIRLFHRPPGQVENPQDSRELGIALAILARSQKIHPRYALSALPRLDSAIQSDANDIEAWEAKITALQALGRRSEMPGVVNAALVRAPKRESLLVTAAVFAQDSNRLDEALGFWKRAADVSPYQPSYHANLARLFEVKGDWAGVRASTDAWLALSPGEPEARRLRVAYLLKAGEMESARREFRDLEALKPKNLGELQAWFQRAAGR